ncbi:MAG: hypothetical protein GY832_19140 [Chloroflexi bacterium]|nr:hypothetical protein [Chloroflexota bacterium]
MDKKVLGVFVVLAMAAMACTCSNLVPGGGGGTDPVDPPPPPEQVLFQDDFGNSGSGWEVGEYDDGDVGYKDGAYFVTSTKIETLMWGVANRSFDNVIIEVDATQVAAGPESNNAYGVACREQGSADGYGYYLRISGDGFYSIAKAANGEFTALIDWTESDAINQGNATNRIRAICNGSTLELFVNGQRLGSVEDSTFASGDVALTATTYEDVMTEVHFDNLMVLKP